MQKYEKFVRLIFNRSQQVRRSNPILIHCDLALPVITTICYHFYACTVHTGAHTPISISKCFNNFKMQKCERGKTAPFAHFHLYTHILSHAGIITIFHWIPSKRAEPINFQPDQQNNYYWLFACWMNFRMMAKANSPSPSSTIGIDNNSRIESILWILNS